MNGPRHRFTERDLLPLSALQHLVFCERQAALIHVEHQWRDNVLTIEGSRLHSRVHDSGPRRERRGDCIICRGLALRSLELGLAGRADVVEFHRADPSTEDAAKEPGSAIALPGEAGCWTVFPVEYKRGRPKSDRCDEVQLCAQALCLEEMLGTTIPAGALFYGKQQRRDDVVFDLKLRAIVTATADRLHELASTGETPKAIKTAKCRRCSLLALCMPEAMTRRSASGYIRRVVGEQAPEGL